MNLFESIPTGLQPESDASEDRPLAERMRPRTLDEYIGQEHLLGPGKPLQAQIANGRITSLILWGPPGSGKTTLASLISGASHSDFIPFSAVLSGIKEIKAVMVDAEKAKRLGSGRSCLWTRSIASTKRNRTPFSPTLSAETLF